MQEKNVEQQLVRTIKAMGGFSPKLVSPGMDGMSHVFRLHEDALCSMQALLTKEGTRP